MPKCIVIRLMATIKYLIAKDTDFQWGLVTKTVGLQDVVPGSPYPPKGHPEDHDFQPEGGRILQDILSDPDGHGDLPFGYLCAYCRGRTLGLYPLRIHCRCGDL